MRGTSSQLHDGIPAWAVRLHLRRNRRRTWSAVAWFALCAVLSYSAFQGGTSPGRSSPLVAEAAVEVRVASAAALASKRIRSALSL